MSGDNPDGRIRRHVRLEGEGRDGDDDGLGRNASVTVPFGSFRHALRTLETTALEPDVLDTKYYVKGIGQVAELSMNGPQESLRLVEIIS